MLCEWSSIALCEWIPCVVESNVLRWWILNLIWKCVMMTYEVTALDECYEIHIVVNWNGMNPTCFNDGAFNGVS